VTGQDNFAARLTLKRTRQSRHPELMKTTQSPDQPVTRADHNLSGRIRPGRAGVWACVAGFAAVLAGASPAAGGAASQDAPAATRLAEPARTWVVDCARNEVLVIQHPDSYLRFRLHEVDEKGDRVRDEIETPDGGVARLILRDGRPLTPGEDAAERERLNILTESPADFARHVRREQENKKTGIRLIQLMPDAMQWSYAPGQPQLPNQPAGQPALVVLDFKPNPKWSPPNLESEPLTGLEGRVWIDPQTRRMVHLEGSLFQAVNIGWGIVAHIYPGGTVALQQTNAGGQRWIVEHIVEQLTLRALMVKNVKESLIYDTAQFQPVPAMKYQQAIKLLLDTPLPSH
jgi:hypothetical protein